MIYAINQLTKEHRVVQNGCDGDAGKFLPGEPSGNTWLMVKADAEGWIEWSGGERPLPKLVKCEHIMRCAPNNDTFHTELAGHLRWTHENLSGDIIAYRPILEPQAEQVKELGVGDHVVFPSGRGVIRLAPDVNNVVIVEDYNDGYKRVALSACEPIRTDRERWIEAADAVTMGEPSKQEVLRIIYDAGLARLTE